MKLLLALWIHILSLFKKEEVNSSDSHKPLLPLNLQFFADDPPEVNEGGDNDPPSGDEDEPFAVFKTKDDLNKRLSRAEKKGQKELAKQLGFESVEEMQEALNKTKNKEPKEPPEKEEPVDVDTIIEKKLKEERQKTFKRLVNSEVKLIANELGFTDWEDALALADLSEVKEDDKGNIVGVKEALEELAKKKPHLLKQTKNNRFGADIPNGGGQRSKSKLEDIKKLAQSRGENQSSTFNPWG